MELEERIKRLEDIEAIRFLQARYQRCLDTRNFDEMTGCLAPDVVSSYDGGKMSYSGRDEVISLWYLEDHLLNLLTLKKTVFLD